MSGYTPLMLAASASDENLDAVKLLVSKGADTKIKDFNDNTLIHIATMYNNKKVLEYLLTIGDLNPLDRNKKGETALSIAKEKNNSDLTEIL